MKYLNGLKKIPTFTERHDKDSKEFYGFLYRPQTWQPNNVYEDGEYAIPTNYTGWYLEVNNPGKSGTDEPNFDLSKPDAITKEDNSSLSWYAKKYNLLPIEHKILASSWACDNPDVVLDAESFTDVLTYVRVASVPDEVDSIIISNTTIRGESVLAPEDSKEVIVRSIILKIGDT